VHSFQGQIDDVCRFVGQRGVRSRDLDNLLGRLAHNVSLFGRRMLDLLRLRMLGYLLRMGLLFHHFVFVTGGDDWGRSRGWSWG
jgi:hypothetical protein